MEPLSTEPKRGRTQPVTLEQLQQRILLRAAEVGFLLGLPISTVYRHCNSTEWASFVVRIGGVIRIDREGLEQYIADKRHQGVER